MRLRYQPQYVLEKYSPIIGVFGSSSCSDSSDLYKLAYNVGKVIANSNFVSAHGGYTCIMDALSKGAKEAGGKSIGITTDEITRADPSPYLTEEFREYSLFSRLELIFNISSAYLFLPGSTGTLTELALAWDKQKLGLLPIRPCLLFGKVWEKIFRLMFYDNEEIIEKSKWKKDDEVEQNTFIIKSIQELSQKLKELI